MCKENTLGSKYCCGRHLCRIELCTEEDLGGNGTANIPGLRQAAMTHLSGFIGDDCLDVDTSVAPALRSQQQWTVCPTAKTEAFIWSYHVLIWRSKWNSINFDPAKPDKCTYKDGDTGERNANAVAIRKRMLRAARSMRRR